MALAKAIFLLYNILGFYFDKKHNYWEVAQNAEESI